MHIVDGLHNTAAECEGSVLKKLKKSSDTDIENHRIGKYSSYTCFVATQQYN